ncbi:MAG: hypothetical protein IKK73_01410 [Akkermansia sp.]|nr:hypothetical protein [Akkermansia sp.]
MELSNIEYIRIGIWSSGIVFTLLLTSLLTRIFYRAVIRPWRRIAPLTVADLKTRRKYKHLKETWLMKLIKLGIWISGTIFTLLMVWGIALCIRYNFQGAPIKKIFFLMMSSENVDKATELADIERTSTRIGSTKNEMLREINAEIARIEQESGDDLEHNPALMADYKSLCLTRDILEGKVTRTPAQEAKNTGEDKSSPKKKRKKKKRNDSSSLHTNY